MMDQRSPVDGAFFARLRSEDAAFSAGLPGMLDELAMLDDAPALQYRLDTLAGCASTFGYRRLGREARLLEQRLRVLRAFETVSAPHWHAWFGALAELVAWARADPRAGAAL